MDSRSGDVEALEFVSKRMVPEGDRRITLCIVARVELVDEIQLNTGSWSAHARVPLRGRESTGDARNLLDDEVDDETAKRMALHVEALTADKMKP